MKIARSLIGTKEIPGPKHNQTILGWCKKLGARVLGITVNDDETPWCGTFAAWCVVSAGLTPPKIAVRAKAWAAFGKACSPVEGAVLVFGREGGGHVGFYVGEDATAYHVLGGNQSNTVNITRIAKSRLIASRWPSGVPVTGLAKVLKADGTLSKNEA